jgi:DNA-binding GntR family transcriptional regulator
MKTPHSRRTGSRQGGVATVKEPVAKRPQRKVARHKVRDAIEKLILEGRIRPGEKLVQLQLSRMFDVSLGMVREALFELQRSGLIEAIDNLGMFVRKLDADMIREFYTARELFEGLAARECCGRLTSEQAAELRGLADQIYETAANGREQEKATCVRKFHSRMVEISGNRLLVSLGHQYRVLGKVVGAVCDPADNRDRHLAIVDAIERGDPDEAEHVVRKAIRSARKIVEEKLASGSPDVYWLT